MSGDTLLTKDTDFVMVRRYRDLPEAVIVKSILDAEGIDCVLSDENLVRMDWFWSNLLGGVKLWVRLSVEPRNSESTPPHAAATTTASKRQ